MKLLLKTKIIIEEYDAVFIGTGVWKHKFNIDEVTLQTEIEKFLLVEVLKVDKNQLYNQYLLEDVQLCPLIDLRKRNPLLH